MKNAYGQEISLPAFQGLDTTQRRWLAGIYITVPASELTKRVLSSVEITRPEQEALQIPRDVGKIAAEKAIDNSKTPGKKWGSVLPKIGERQ